MNRREEQIERWYAAERARDRGQEIHAELERMVKEVMAAAPQDLEAMVSSDTFRELGAAPLEYKGIPVIDGGDLLPDDEVFVINRKALEAPLAPPPTLNQPAAGDAPGVKWEWLR